MSAVSAHRRAVFTGTLYALAAGLMWGLVFIAPTMLAEYPAALLTVGRYLAFGLIALPLAWWGRARLAQLTRADWLEALKLSAVGNLLYYLCSNTRGSRPRRSAADRVPRNVAGVGAVPSRCPARRAR